jgi:vancomycin permeability regulator SanA
MTVRFRKVLKNLKTIIASNLFRCEYAHRCGHYNPKAFTCNTPNAEGGYCGLYRELVREDFAKKMMEKDN